MKSFCLTLCLYFVLRCCSGQTIYDQLTALNATTFKSLVDQAGLAHMLSSAGPWTVLVPTNAAFAKIPAQDLSAVINNTAVATDVIKYHMLQGQYNSYSFMFIKHYRYNSTNGHVLRIHRSANGLFFNQAKAVKSNINATNGMIFLINTVLDVPEGTVTEILANPSYNISKFLQLVRKAKLDQHYNNRVTLNRYTMFAPNDAAVDAIPAAERTRIDSDSVYARLYVEYHVHSGTLHASSVAKRRSISTTYPGKSITVNLLAGGMKLNNVAQILYPDIEADNGIVHIISHALTPPPDSSINGLFFNQAKAVKSNINATNGMIFLINTVLDVPEGTVTEILANPSYNISKFLQLVRKAKLDQHYNNRVTLNRYTMFAPNDAAVDAIPAAERTRIDSDSVYARLYVEYHVHSGTLHASSVAKRRSISTTYPGKSITVNLLAGGMKLNNVAQILYPDIEADNGIVHIISHALTPPPDSSIIG